MRNSFRLILLLLTAAVTLLSLSACSIKDRPYCEHCHQTKVDTSHHITVGTVDTTVCTDCYQQYKNGAWTFP